MPDVSPLKIRFWKGWYNLLARKFPQPDLTFMNYGYSYEAEQLPPPAITCEDEANRYYMQLYHRVIGGVEVAGKSVVEVGSGRGGGARFVMMDKQPRAYIGIDLSAEAVRFCRESHPLTGLTFQQGEAEKTGLKAGCADVALNVESSHCYPSRSRFFAEVLRILRPGGAFVWADMVPATEIAELNQTFIAIGFEIVEKNDITSGVITALDCVSADRSQMIGRLAPFYLRKALLLFAGTPGTVVYERLKSGELKYLRYQLRKP